MSHGHFEEPRLWIKACPMSKRIGSRMVFEKREKQLAKKAQESWRQRAAELVLNSCKFNAQRQMPGGERGDVDREDPAFGKSS